MRKEYILGVLSNQISVISYSSNRKLIHPSSFSTIMHLAREFFQYSAVGSHQGGIPDVTFIQGPMRATHNTVHWFISQALTLGCPGLTAHLRYLPSPWLTTQQTEVHAPDSSGLLPAHSDPLMALENRTTLFQGLILRVPAGSGFCG